MKHRLIYAAPAVLAAMAMAGCASTGTIAPSTSGSPTSPSTITTPGPPHAGGSADRSDSTTGSDSKNSDDAKPDSVHRDDESNHSDGKDHDGKDHDGKDHDGKDHDGKDHDGKDHESTQSDDKDHDGSSATKGSKDRSDEKNKDKGKESKTSEAEKQDTHKSDSNKSDSDKSGQSEKHASDPLSYGDSGPRVAKLQERLKSLGYWVSGTDGNFGPTTRQAVYAVQKVAGLSRDGVVGANTRRAITSGARPTPHSTSGHVVEVDLKRQIVMVVDGGHVDTVLNTSTASGKHYTSEGHRYLAVTPTGKYTVSRQINGTRHSKLGYLWRPKYFNGGIALHGEKTNVPPYPVSHGCVRVTNAAMNWIWQTDQVPVGTAVWVY